MLYMIIEQFKNQDPVPVCRRFRDHGRLAPDRKCEASMSAGKLNGLVKQMYSLALNSRQGVT